MTDKPVTATAACPSCGSRLQQHSLTWWCLSCGWARNKPQPGDGSVVGAFMRLFGVRRRTP